jgi:alkanesulfonate monooxygenase SsuD/methylene tetrahydromethanopterin reductase-like flavin-dependent oxidoreductase (luciferase family)
MPETTAPTVVEARVNGGIYALNRFLMTLQSKRMPVADLAIGHSGEATRITLALDCPPETARRYATLLSGLEDVEEVRDVEETVEVALVDANTEGWREAAKKAGVGGHEEDGTVVVSGSPEKVGAWVEALGEEGKNVLRLGPVARPETEGF